LDNIPPSPALRGRGDGGVAQALACDSGSQAKACATPRCEGGETRAPASPAQRQMWFLHQLGQGSDVYTIAYSFRLAGDTDPAALRTALTALAERHAALRTTFTDESGSLEQVIAPPGLVELPVTDLSQQPPVERAAELRRLADGHARA